MKPLNKTIYIVFLLLFGYSCTVQQKHAGYNQDQAVGFQVFYDELSPYGNWVDYPNYGYIWIPDVRREFAPYFTNGHWIMTDYGWTWVSDYRWGWAPFHYGQWDYDDYYGWFWVPDNEWGPAWVTWRGGNGYYGWAPMRPGMSINSSYNDEYRDINRWRFVRDKDFGRNDLDRYYINRGNYTTIINNSTIINNTTVDRRRNVTYVAGPQADNVQRATGRNINKVRIQDNERPGQKLANNELKIYRPQLESTAGRRTAPSKVTDIHQIKPVRERGSANSRNDITPVENTGNQRQTEQLPQKERRRIAQPMEKNTQIPQPQPTSPEMTPAQPQDQNVRRRMERQRIQQGQRQNREKEQNNPGVTQQPVPQPPVSEQNEIQQEQQVKQDITKQEQVLKRQQEQVQQQQRQVEKQQQQLERQQQQQRRRQERQETRQQQQQIEKSQRIQSTQPAQQQNEQEQKEPTPSGSRRR